MKVGVVGRKIGMTRCFQESGQSIPVTVVEIVHNRIVRLKTVECDGYNAIVVASGSQKPSRLNQAERGFYAKVEAEPAASLCEFRVDSLDDFQLAQPLQVDQFEVGELVDVSGISKGKGFQGGVKRHNFSTQDSTHGNSLSHRALGSTGQNQSPGKVFKGKKMPGQMGNARCTTQNLEVIKVDVDRSVLLIKGAVPGAPGGKLIVSPAVKV